MAANPFEIPPQLREAAEKNVEQASTAYAQLIAAMTDVIETWSKPAAATHVTNNFNVLQDQAIAYAKENAEAGLALARDLARAKDLNEVFSLQTKFARSQMQAYVHQAQELGKLAAQAFQNF